MATAEILLALVQLGRLGMDAYEDYQRGELTDEQLAEAAAAMRARLKAASDKVQAS